MENQTNLFAGNLVSEVELNYKSKRPLSQMKKISNSTESVEIFRAMWSNKMDYIEEMTMIGLNRGCKVIGFFKISIGGTAATVVDTKIVLQAALLMNAHAIILCHNHPSGNYEPSNADIKLTEKLKQAALLLEINLLDHIILTNESFYSFADQGKI